MKASAAGETAAMAPGKTSSMKASAAGKTATMGTTKASSLESAGKITAGHRR